MYTTAHENDFEKVVKLAKQIEPIHWDDLDPRDPRNGAEEGWREVDYFDDCDEDLDEGYFKDVAS